MSRSASIYSSELSSAAEAAVNKVVEGVTGATTTLGRGMNFGASFSGFMTQPGNMFQSGTRLFFYLAVGALALFLFLTFLHFTVTPIFSFMPGDSGIITIAPSGPKQYAFLNGPTDDGKRIDFEDFKAFNISFAFDIYIRSEFATTVPRVLFYSSPSAIALGATDTKGSLPTKFPGSNLVLYLDPQTNDLHAMILYTDSTTGDVQAKHELCVENMPLQKPVRIGVILFQKFVEIYMDGKLVRTIPGDGDLLVNEASGTTIWGPPDRVRGSVSVARITYWPYLVSPQTMRLDAAEAKNPALFAST
jgi:hypothetical protein